MVKFGQFGQMVGFGQLGQMVKSCSQTKWFCIRVQLQSPKLQIGRYISLNNNILGLANIIKRNINYKKVPNVVIMRYLI